MIEELQTTLETIRRVQALRRLNRRNGEVISERIEADHIAELAKLQTRVEQLSTAGRVVNPDETPADFRPHPYRDGGRESVGTTLCQ